MSPEHDLQKRLEPVFARQRHIDLWRSLAICWVATAFLGLFVILVQWQFGWASSLSGPILLAIAAVAAAAIVVRHRRVRPDWRQLAQLIETSHPELEGRLITAVQQPDASGAELNYLQQRVIEEALVLSRKRDWTDVIPKRRLLLAQTIHWSAIGLCALMLWTLPRPEKRSWLARISNSSITVTPGDVTLERGSSLVVLARFAGTLPASVQLVTSQVTGTNHAIPLIKSLADPLFGGSLPEVSSNFTYYIQYAGQRTRDFRVTVFEYPSLDRSDLEVKFPDYTKQPSKRIENSRRLSAVEGSQLGVSLLLNKPVASAQLVPRDTNAAAIILLAQTNRPAATVTGFSLEKSHTYDLRLVDVDGRTNKIPAQFVFQALKNATPELKITSPAGDIRPSALEEVSFEGTVWDDFGVAAYGLAYTLPGQETRFIELGRDVRAREKKPFKHVLRLEELGLQPDDLVAWFFWADDTGPDGKPRRTSGDLYFAEVRPFDEIFRVGDQPSGGEGESGQGQSGQAGKLVELQKKIISATWNLQRQHGVSSKPESKPASPSRRESRLDRKPKVQGLASPPATRPFFPVFGQASGSSNPSASDGANPSSPKAGLDLSKAHTYPENAAVVRDSQAQALEQAQDAASRGQDPRAQGLWATAVKEMEAALARLNNASNSPVNLPDALAAEQAAYQALLKLQEHEYQVVRNRNRSSSGQASNQDRRRDLQLEQMDLAQSENRYETQRQAQRPQNKQFQEQLQIMNRLQDLARRQQDLNDRFKELQTALQEARTEQEREEIRRRLKRLQEEEQQMLADVDELRQRMDRSENQSQMSEERKQLEQTRQDIQRAADASSQGEVSQALAAGTRAQRQLQEMRDQMRKENANQFAEDLRQMRADARELARRQEEMLKKLEGDSANGEPRRLTDAPQRDQVIQELAQQKQKMTNLVERAGQVSQQAEAGEPLLSKQLYDILRKFAQDNQKTVQQTQDELFSRRLMTEKLSDRLKDASQSDAEKLLDVASEMLRQDFRRQASDTLQRGRVAIEDLKHGVEQAAGNILGDDTEALRLAQQEIDQLTEQLQREMAESEGTNALAGAAQNGSTPDTKPSEPQAQPGREAAQQGSTSSARSPGEKSSPDPSPGQNGQNSQAQTSPGSPSTANTPSSEQAGKRSEAASAGGPGGRNNQNETGGAWLDRFDRVLHDDSVWQGGPLTGGNYGPWSDRLRNVEEVLEFPDLRTEVATARERARLLRQDFKREKKKPDWAVVRTQVMKPLAEVRARIADELARRQASDALVPIDRDPVPSRYSELVRRYYEELGKTPEKAAGR